MSSEDEAERWTMMAVLDHLQKATSKPGMNTESLQEAIFAISNAYTLNMHSSSTKQRYPLDGLLLPQVYKAGRESLLNNSKNPAASEVKDETTTSRDINMAEKSEGTEDPGFDRFVKKLESSTSFFSGIEKESEEYKKRIVLARQKYDDKLKSKKQKIENERNPNDRNNNESSSTITEKKETDTKKNTEEEKAKAKLIKEKGNAQLKAKQYELALKSYSECIELDSENAVYYSNRAAANILLSRFTDAVDDCKKAISLDSAFERPRERLASAYRHLGMTKNEVDCLRAASSQFPVNNTFKNMLQDAENRLNSENSSNPAAAPSGLDPAMIDMMSRSMGINMPDGFAQTLASSDIVNQVGGMVRDNPAMLEQMMRMMGSGAGANNNPPGGSG